MTRLLSLYGKTKKTAWTYHLVFVLGGETVEEQEHSKADDGGDQQADSSGDCSGGGHAL